MTRNCKGTIVTIVFNPYDRTWIDRSGQLNQLCDSLMHGHDRYDRVRSIRSYLNRQIGSTQSILCLFNVTIVFDRYDRTWIDRLGQLNQFCVSLMHGHDRYDRVQSIRSYLTRQIGSTQSILCLIIARTRSLRSCSIDTIVPESTDRINSINCVTRYCKGMILTIVFNRYDRTRIDRTGYDRVRSIR